MLPTRKTLFLANLLLIAIGCIDLSIAADLFGSVPNPVLSNTECQKMEETFNRFDFDKNGVISRADMKDIGAKFADQEKFQQADKDKAIKSCDDLFSFYAALVGTTGDELTKEMVANCKNTDVSSDDRAQCKKIIGAVLDSLVDPMNVAQKGFLSSDEFTRLFKSLGITDATFTTLAYQVSDANHDGKVSVQEFHDSTTKYLCTNDKKFIL